MEQSKHFFPFRTILINIFSFFLSSFHDWTNSSSVFSCIAELQTDPFISKHMLSSRMAVDSKMRAKGRKWKENVSQQSPVRLLENEELSNIQALFSSCCLMWTDVNFFVIHFSTTHLDYFHLKVDSEVSRFGTSFWAAFVRGSMWKVAVFVIWFFSKLSDRKRRENKQKKGTRKSLFEWWRW